MPGSSRDPRNPRRSDSNPFSAGSGSLSDDSDAGEVLPPAPGVYGVNRIGALKGQIAELGADGKWFTHLDER